MVTKCLWFLIRFLYENDRQKHFHEVSPQEPLFSLLPKDKPPPRIIIHNSPAALEKKNSVCVRYYYYDNDDDYYYYYYYDNCHVKTSVYLL
jgi:hypothetical protein